MIGVFLDSETNGLNHKVHKILEIAFKIVDLMDGTIRSAYQSVLVYPIEIWEKSDPESLKVNGFTWEEIQKGREIPFVSEQIIDLFVKHKIKRKEAVFICQNPSFDRVFFSQIVDPDTQELLGWPYHWLDLASMYWAISIQKARQNLSPYPWQTGFSKDKIAESYKIPPENKPHRAMNGVDHLLLCYKTVVGFKGVVQ